MKRGVFVFIFLALVLLISGAVFQSEAVKFKVMSFGCEGPSSSNERGADIPSEINAIYYYEDVPVVGWVFREEQSDLVLNVANAVIQGQVIDRAQGLELIKYEGSVDYCRYYYFEYKREGRTFTYTFPLADARVVDSRPVCLYDPEQFVLDAEGINSLGGVPLSSQAYGSLLAAVNQGESGVVSLSNLCKDFQQTTPEVPEECIKGESSCDLREYCQASAQCVIEVLSGESVFYGVKYELDNRGNIVVVEDNDGKPVYNLHEITTMADSFIDGCKLRQRSSSSSVCLTGAARCIAPSSPPSTPRNPDYRPPPSQGGGTVPNQPVGCQAPFQNVFQQQNQNQAECGNNKKEGSEQCDGTDLNGKTCKDFGFIVTEGLSCYPKGHEKECQFNKESCSDCSPGKIRCPSSGKDSSGRFVCCDKTTQKCGLDGRGGNAYCEPKDCSAFGSGYVQCPPPGEGRPGPGNNCCPPGYTCNYKQENVPPACCPPDTDPEGTGFGGGVNYCPLKSGACAARYGAGWIECTSDCCNTNIGEKCVGTFVKKCMKDNPCASNEFECENSGVFDKDYLCCITGKEKCVAIGGEKTCMPLPHGCNAGETWCPGKQATPYADSSTCCGNGKMCAHHPDGTPYCIPIAASSG
jgi:hypothetical protein